MPLEITIKRDTGEYATAVILDTRDNIKSNTIKRALEWLEINERDAFWVAIEEYR